MSLVRRFHLFKVFCIPDALVIRHPIAVGLRAIALFAVVACVTSLMPNQTIAAECAGGEDSGQSDSLACGTGPGAFDTATTFDRASVALGTRSRTQGSSSTAVGYSSGTGTGQENTAIGYQAQGGYFSDSSGTTAVGAFAKAGSAFAGTHNATALGTFAYAEAMQATALGAYSTANHAGSMAIGYQAETTRENQVMVGNEDNTYTLAGINSAASKAAQSGPFYFVTSDSDGNLATTSFDIGEITALDGRVTTNTQNIAALDNRVTTLENGFQDLGNRIASNQKEARGGTALALAAASLRYDDRPEKLSIAGGVGHFKGLTGMSFGVGYATSESLRFNAAISGVPENGDVGFSAGASWTLN